MSQEVVIVTMKILQIKTVRIYYKLHILITIKQLIKTNSYLLLLFVSMSFVVRKEGLI